MLILFAAGIGEATVHALVRRGARVLIIDVNDDDGEALVILHGPKAMYMHCEVTCAANTRDCSITPPGSSLV